MRLRYHDINKDGKLRHMIADDLYSDNIKQVFDAKTGRHVGHMIADDLYSDNIKQVFDAKTGRHVGHIQSGMVTISEEQPEELPAPVERDPRQGTLF